MVERVAWAGGCAWVAWERAAEVAKAFRSQRGVDWGEVAEVVAADFRAVRPVVAETLGALEGSAETPVLPLR